MIARPQPDGMNEYERAYSMLLYMRQKAGEVRSYQFEGMKLRVGIGAWYTPDFAPIWMGDDTVEIHEVKGFWREAARVRIKSAAMLFPIFTFYAVTSPRRGGWSWNVERIPAHP